MDILDARPWYVRTLDHLDRPGGVGRWLAPLGVVAAAGVGLARTMRPVRVAPSPPVSIGVGNLRVGGTGKTPVVEDLARRWRERGREVAVVTRGYRSSGHDDEPGWLRARGLPTFVDPDRAAALEQARAAGTEIALLDDALQSRLRPQLVAAIVLDRDLRRCPRPLPAGPAREGRAGLRRADALLVRVEEDAWPVTPDQAAAYQEQSRALCGGPAFAFRSVPIGLVDTEGRSITLDLERERVLLVSGLARPASFEKDARGMPLPVVGAVRFEDHARFDAREATRIQAMRGRVSATCVVCPQKNAARLWRIRGLGPVLALAARLDWAGPDPLDFFESRLPTA